MTQLIATHGGTLVNRIVDGKEREGLLAGASNRPAIELDACGLSDVEMLAIGVFRGLEGFLTKRDYESVVTSRRLSDGLVWTIPVALAVPAEQAKGLSGDVALTANGAVVAILHLEETYRPDKTREAQEVFRTTDLSHPGVARLRSTGEVYLGGRVSGVNRPKAATFLPHRLHPKNTRRGVSGRGRARL